MKGVLEGKKSTSNTVQLGQADSMEVDPAAASENQSE